MNGFSGDPSEGPSVQVPGEIPERRLLPELWQRVASSLPKNEVACNLRLVCKEADEQLHAVQYRTVLCSEPVPVGAFSTRWARPGSTRSLSLEVRRQLICACCASGVIDNLITALHVSGEGVRHGFDGGEGVLPSSQRERAVTCGQSIHARRLHWPGL